MFRDFKTLLQLTRGQRHRFAAAAVALALSVALGHLVPLACGGLVDAGARAHGLTDAATAGRLERLAGPLAARPWTAVLVVVGLTAAAGLFAWLRDRLVARACEDLVRDLREQMHDHLQRLPMRWLQAADSGDLVQRCSSDVETVRQFLSTQVMEIARAVTLVALALPVMLWLDVRMTLVTLVLFPIIFGFATVFFRRVKNRFLAADEAEAAMTSVLQEDLAGARVIIGFARGDHERARFGRAAAGFRDKQLDVFNLMASYWASAEILAQLQVALPIFLGGALVGRGELSVGALYAFMAWVMLLVWPVRQLGRTLTDSGKAVVALARIREVLEVPREADPETPAALPRPAAGRIELRGLAFAHADGRRVLDGIDLAIEPGEVVALVGPPGCGKTTLVALLLRLEDPQEGAILVDGVDIATLPRRAVRSMVATVPQEPFLYARTVEANIRAGRRSSTRDEVEEAARAACIHESIAAFPQGYETIVGERGVTLSGGQRQRVAIARALLDDAPILVLDDALSAVDTRTEARIREALTARRGRRTCLVIAHRLTTTRQADRVIVLRDGRIVQSGTHDALAAVEGPYRRLWDVQVEMEEGLRGDLHVARSRGGVA